MKKIIIFFFIGISGVISGALMNDFRTKKSEGNKLRKFRLYYNLLNQWLFLKNKGVNLETYFIEKKWNSVAIYGMGEAGERLYEELEKSKIEIRYGIDRNRFDSALKLPIYDLTNELEPVDVIVVTPIFDHRNIEREIKNNLDYNVVSLYDIIFGIS